MKTPTKKTGNRRLLKLAEFLEKLPRKKFDYTHWYRAQSSDAYKCGTTACAIGWAATMPEFKRLGLKINVRDGCDVINGYEKVPVKVGTPVCGGYQEEAVAIPLFGLADDEALDLFFPKTTNEDRATPKYVAKKIRKFVKARGDV